MLKQYTFFLFFWVITLAFSCTAPKAIVNSGKVTPKGDFRAGFDYTINVPTQTLGAVKDNLSEYVDKVRVKDTVLFDAQAAELSKAVLAFSLDPIGSGMDFYLRYGILKRVDAGYKYASGVHVWDAMYQFAGPTGNFKDETNDRFYGSIGLQYSSQEYKFPSVLDKAADLLQLSFKRKDLLIPLIFSVSFGNEEKTGAFSFGLVHSRTWVRYGFNPEKLYRFSGNAFEPIKGIDERKSFGSTGGFLNLKLGYRFVYFTTGLSIYRTNYGIYKMANKEDVKLKGWTFVPAFGLQLNPSEIYRAVSKKEK